MSASSKKRAPVKAPPPPSMPSVSSKKPEKKKDKKPEKIKAPAKKQRTNKSNKDAEDIESSVFDEQAPPTPEIPVLPTSSSLRNDDDGSLLHPGEFTPVTEDHLKSPPVDLEDDESEEEKPKLKVTRKRGRPRRVVVETKETHESDDADAKKKKTKGRGRPPLLDVQEIMSPEDWKELLALIKKYPQMANAVATKLKIPVCYTDKGERIGNTEDTDDDQGHVIAVKKPDGPCTIYQLTAKKMGQLRDLPTNSINSSFFQKFLTSMKIHSKLFVNAQGCDSLLQLLPEDQESFKINLPAWFDDLHNGAETMLVPQTAMIETGTDSTGKTIFRRFPKGELVIQRPFPAIQERCDKLNLYPAVPNFRYIDPSCVEPDKIMHSYDPDPNTVKTPLQKFYDQFTTDMARFCPLPPSYTYGAMTIYHVGPEVKGTFQQLNTTSPCMIVILPHDITLKKKRGGEKKNIFAHKKPMIDLSEQTPSKKKKPIVTELLPRVPYIFVPAGDQSTISGLIATNDFTGLSHILLFITIVKDVMD